MASEKSPLLGDSDKKADCESQNADYGIRNVDYGSRNVDYSSQPPQPESAPLLPEPGQSASDSSSDNSSNLDALHSNTNCQSMMNLLKANVGTGILAMPSAIRHAGLVVGTLGLAAIGVIAIHCMHILVNCASYLCEKTGRRSLDYGQVVECALTVGPTKLRRFARAGKVVINVFLGITQFGFCIVYVLFVADNVRQVVEETTSIRFKIQVWEVFVMLLLIPYMFIRRLNILSIFSSLANVITIVGLVVILQYCVRDLPPVSSFPAFATWASLPLWFGIAIYAFEGIGVVLPILEKMSTPEDFGGWTGVLNTGMVVTTVSYIAIGFYGYMRFGDDIKGSVTLNLPTDNWLYLSVKLCFAVGIFISYGVQFYVPFNILWPHIQSRIEPGTKQFVAEYCLRAFIVMLTFAVAAGIPHLDLMIALVGALASSTLALIFPPLLELITYWPDGRVSWLTIIKCFLITFFGIIGFLAGTATSLIQIVQRFQGNSTSASLDVT